MTVSALPDAVQQNPACGACGSETHFDGDTFVCDDCQLCFEAIGLAASFVNPDTEPCAAPCDNYWHGDHLIEKGVGYDCGTCKLPTGHPSKFHWTGCESKPLNPT